MQRPCTLLGWGRLTSDQNSTPAIKTEVSLVCFWDHNLAMISLMENCSLVTDYKAFRIVNSACGVAMAFPICLNATETLVGKLIGAHAPKIDVHLTGSVKEKCLPLTMTAAYMPLFCKCSGLSVCWDVYIAHSVGNGVFYSGARIWRTCKTSASVGTLALFAGGRRLGSP